MSHGVRAHRRTVGVGVLAVLFASSGLALLLAKMYHLGMPQTISAVLVGGGSLSALFLSWVAYSPQEPSLAGMADNLADEVRRQWEVEAEERGLNEPYPLPVSWVGEPSVADAWEKLNRLASAGAGWPGPPPHGAWATDPADLAGRDRELVKVLARVPTGRLVVLGEPGAGKTILMVRLVLDLLAERQPGDPVPVLCPVGSWNPAKQGLDQWLSDMLPFDHPALAAPAPPGTGPGNCVSALFDKGLIFLILDGLDEIPDQYRGQAIKGLNHVMRPGRQLVVTCRTQEYRDVLGPRGGIRETLRGAAAVRLCPLDATDVTGYLRDQAESRSTSRWGPVVDALSHESPIRQALSSPLMVALARAVYDSGDGGTAGRSRNPAELCSLRDKTAVEARLFDEFIPAAYGVGTAGKWSVDDAGKWLVFLARHLEFKIGGPDLAWSDLQRSAPEGLRRIARRISQGLVFGRFFITVLGLVAALATGIVIGTAVGPVDGSLSGLAVGLTVWLTEAAMGVLPGTFATWAALGLTVGVAAGLVGGSLGGAAAGLATGLVFGLAAGRARSRPVADRGRSRGILMSVVGAWLTAGLVAGLGSSTFAGWTIAAAGTAAVVACSRLGVLKDTGWSVLLCGLSAGLAAGTVAAVVAGITPGLAISSAVAVLVAVRGLRLVENRSGPVLTRGRSVGVMSPPGSLALERHTALVQCLGTGLGSALAFGLVIGVLAGIPAALAGGITGGLAAGILCGQIEPAWPTYVLARTWLAAHEQLPWPLMDFLADARRRGVLRQAGAIYQFRHFDLQHRLATRRLPLAAPGVYQGTPDRAQSLTAMGCSTDRSFGTVLTAMATDSAGDH